MGRSFGFGVIVACAIVAAMSPGAFGQTRKPTGEQWEQVRPLFKLVEEVAAGSPAPADVTLKWRCHFLNAGAEMVFVPFTVTIEQGEFTSFPLAMYVRVVTRGAPAPAPGPRDALAQYPFEDAAVVDPPTDGRISRAFAVPAGEYDVYVALREMPHTGVTLLKTVVLKQAVSVPDLKSGLAVSSIIVVDHIEMDRANRRLNFEEQLDEPYRWWGIRMTPATGTRLAHSGKLSVIFLVYNTAAAADDKPDVEVQYSFHQKAAAADTFFTSTKPELFNRQTLPPGFSLAAGDLLIAGQEMPLAAFPEGDFRLEVKVTDKANGQSLTRDVYFTVVGS
jgi:hypothetical protein